jgi:hypothetical protein
MWACHNDREEDQSGSPRESRVTVAPPFRVVKATGCSVKRGSLWPQNSTSVRRSEAWAMVEMRGLEPLTPSLQRRCSPS